MTRENMPFEGCTESDEVLSNYVYYNIQLVIMLFSSARQPFYKA